MQVTIDYTPAVRQGAGIGRLTRGLVRHLVDLASPYRYTLFVAGGLGRHSPHRAGWPPGVSLCTTVLSDWLLAVLWHRLRLPLPVEAFCGDCAIFHSTDFVLPPTTRARTILTIHDLTFLRYPKCAHPNLHAYLSRVVPRSLARADRVLADSEATRQDLIQLLGLEPGRVAVVYGGVEGRFTPATDEGDQEARRRLGLDGPYLLSLGTLEPRKNYERLISAYHLLIQSCGADLPDLVIAGGKGWLYEGLFRLVEELGLDRRVRFLGFVDDADLPALYRGATLFVFPSLYEGFGLPPLEAMACGCPVVCSNTSSLPEVAGDGARLVDPTDIDALVDAIRMVLFDSSTQADLIQRGRQRALRFTWPAAAQALLEQYRILLDQNTD